MRNLILALSLLAGSAFAQIAEEPPLIRAELLFNGGSQFFCIFVGTVDIEGPSGPVVVTGCVSDVIECAVLVSAEINTFAPFVEAEQCAFVPALADGFESKG